MGNDRDLAATVRALVGDRPVPKVVDFASLRVLVVSDGRPGHEGQSLGLLAALGVKDPEVMTLKPLWHGWWGRLVASLLPMSWRYAALPEAGRLDVVVGTGWQVSRVVRWCKRENPNLFAVQLMRPSGRPADYDVVVVPTHDVQGWGVGKWRTAPQVVRTLVAPNRITTTLLTQEAARWEKRVRQVPQPRLAVLVGGASKHGRFGPVEARALAKEVAKLAKQQGLGLLVTTSRRTGAAATRALRDVLVAQSVPHWFWAPPGVLPDEDFGRDNPYMAYLGLAEAVVATADSVSLVSDAVTAGKPVYLWPMGKTPGKFKVLFAGLEEQARVRWWSGTLTLRPPAAGLMDTALAAGFVRSRYTKRG